MRKGFAGLVVLAAVAAAHPISARVDRQAPAKGASVRLYVLDGGILTIKEPTGFGLTRAEVKETDMVSPAFLIVHPTGSLLWDTGLGDHLIGRPASETMVGAFGQTVSASLKGQLMAIGYAPTQMTYVALSHMHFDHVGNANDYATATWLVQRPEWAAMFGDQVPPSNAAAVRYSALRNAKTRILDGDYDVFGDGTVVIKSTPGHTPGHQSLYVRLPKTGPVLLSGDLYHFQESRTLQRVPSFDFDQERSRATRAAVEAFLKQTGTQLWIQHDAVSNARLRKAPQYYE